MEPIVTPGEATLGAVVTNVDLTTLDDVSRKAIECAFLEHAVLIFPSQNLSTDEQVAFAAGFGEIELLTPNPERKSVPISNQKGDGSLYGEADDVTLILRGNEGWHTDSSYMPLAAKASVLSAHVVTREGGQTEWADMRAAYDALDATHTGSRA